MEDFIDIIEDLVKKAMSYYRDFILPNKKYRTADTAEKRILKQLRNELAGYEGNDENELQSIPFNVARMFNETPKNLFKMFYEVVFGQERGPRFGTFVQLVGKEKALNLLDTASSS
jgi:lysyl-tRNA synthetase class 1